MTMFSTQFETLTPKGELNFIGIVHKYFDSYTTMKKNPVSEETASEYIRRYDDVIFPFVNTALPAKEYNEETIQSLIRAIKENSDYTERSFATNLEHLICDPCEAYFNDPANIDVDHNMLWGSSIDYKPSEKDKKASELLIRKSLTIAEEKKAAEILLDPETEQGEYIGLALMFLLGIRNNEACALKFGDIKPIEGHPGSFYIQVYETVQLFKNTLKAGGKTYNAPRRLPIMPILLDLLSKRKEYVASKVSFPCDLDGKTCKSIDDLPIACRKTQYTVRLRSSDLTAAGREFLRNDLRMEEQQVSGISYYMKETENTWEDLKEKDVTTYLLRRNFATHLYTLGFSLTDSQYYMGHALDQTMLNRADFSDDEYLYELYRKLLKHPLNHQEKQYILPKPAQKTGVFYRIRSKEPDDPICLHLSSDTKMTIVEERINSDYTSEIDITRQVNEHYQNKK